MQNIICNYCGGAQAYVECPLDNWFYPSSEQTNFVGDFYMPPNNSYFNTYYPEWRNQPTYPKFQPQEKESELEKLLKSFINSNETRLKNQEVALKNMEIQLGHLTNMLLEESHVSNCGKELEEVENKEKNDLVEESSIATKEKLASKVIFKISIATNVPLPFICRFIKKEENKKEILKTFEKEEINKPFMDAIK